METVAAREAKNSFGKLLDAAQREPVAIAKKGRPVAVVLSKHDYDAMQRELQNYRSEAETAFLLRGGNAERLKQSLREVEQGRVVVKSIEELEAMTRDED